MRGFLIVLIVINSLASFLIFANAKSAIHEILAAVTFLTAAVLLGAQAIMGSIAEAQQDIGSKIDGLRRSMEDGARTTSTGGATPPLRQVAMPAPEPASPRGVCPNCKAVIAVDAKNCPRCKASFSADSAYKVQPL